MASIWRSTSSGHPSRRSSTTSGVARTAAGFGTASSSRRPTSSPPATRTVRRACGRGRTFSRDLHDHAEGPERAGHQLVDVVPGHALHRPGAALHQPAVAGRRPPSRQRCRGSARPAGASASWPPPRSRHPPWPAAARRTATPGLPRPGCGRGRRPASRPRPPRSSRPARRPRARRAGSSTARRRPRTGSPLSTWVRPPTTSTRRRSAVASRIAWTTSSLSIGWIRSTIPPGCSGRPAAASVPRAMAKSPQRAPAGSTFCGFIRPSGSKARADAGLRAEVDVGEHERHEVALLQADAVLAGEGPAGLHAQARRSPRWPRAPARACPGIRRSNESSGCRLPSPAWKTFITMRSCRLAIS